jgi:hypothetical protein
MLGFVMGLLTAEDRALVERARQIKARQRKEAKKARPRQVRPERSDKAEGALRERRPRVRDNSYLAWIRRLPCLAMARMQGVTVYGCDAAHVRSGYPEPGWSWTGMAQKPDDFRAVPLSRAMHTAQHSMSEAKFWADLNLYPPAVCERLRAAYEAGEDGAVVIAEISKWETDRG